MALIKDWQRAKKGRGSITTVILCFAFLLTAKLIPKTFCINMSDNIISGRLLWKTLFIFVFHKFSFSFFICHIINLADHALHVKLNFLCEHILDFIFERSWNYFCYFFNCPNIWKYGFCNAIWTYSLQNSTTYYFHLRVRLLFFRGFPGFHIYNLGEELQLLLF